jgi:hypothetical protein
VKKKNKFSGKRPVMFYQEGHGVLGGYTNGPRIRIFYPNGKSEWASLSYPNYPYFEFNCKPCWINEERPPENIKEAIEQVNLFDKQEGFKRMIFLGEL